MDCCNNRNVNNESICINCGVTVVCHKYSAL